MRYTLILLATLTTVSSPAFAGGLSFDLPRLNFPTEDSRPVEEPVTRVSR